MRHWTEAEEALLRREYATAKAGDLARRLGRSQPAVWHRARELGLHKRRGPAPGTQPKGKTDPSPDEIERRAAAIRAEWDEATESLRRVGGPQPWTLPVMHVEKAPLAVVVIEQCDK